ncbi:hypothetical protein ACROYT_G033622 [Oculina patagonica]
MADGYALIGYVFANVSVAGALNCYQICQPNCRCISFNFLTNVKQDNCQLNEENRHLKPSALVPMKGSQYYEVVITYGVKTGTSWSPCSQCINRCCSDQPCFNGGTCREKCEAAGKRFVCACPAGFVGQLCEKDCKKALGMESRAISDEQISASSEIDSIHAAIQGRLHFQETMPYKAGGWAAARADNNQWLQVDLGSLNMIVTGVATQGRNSQEYYQWVTKYKLQHSNDGANFEYYKEEGQNADKEFAGNTDSNTVVYHGLNPPIKARYIRFQPVAWNRHIMMRVELYGCQAFQQYNGTMGKDQTTTPATSYPTLYDKCVGSFTSPADHNTKDAGDGAYGLSSLSEKTRISNHLQMLCKGSIFSSVIGVVWFGMVWCGVVWCDVVCRGVAWRAV